MGGAGSSLNDPLVIALLAGVVGYLLRQFTKQGEGVQSAHVVDANVLARLTAVEQWQRDNRTIHADFQRLTAIVEGLAKSVDQSSREMSAMFDRLTRRVDGWMSSHPLDLRERDRIGSPYDTTRMSDWRTPGEGRQ